MAEDIKKRNKRQNVWIKENKDRINMMFSKGFKDLVSDAASKAGLSISQYVELAVYERITNDNSKNQD